MKFRTFEECEAFLLRNSLKRMFTVRYQKPNNRWDAPIKIAALSLDAAEDEAITILPSWAIGYNVQPVRS